MRFEHSTRFYYDLEESAASEMMPKKKQHLISFDLFY